MIIYSKSSNSSNAAIGKLSTPIKMIIEHESNNIMKKGGVAEWLFNIEKSNRFGETIVTQSEFDMFKSAAEGASAELDCVGDAKSKFIEHIQFMKEFIISAEMMEDAQNGVAAEAKRRAENFARAYHKTKNKLCTFALAKANVNSASFNGTTIDFTTADGLPLYSNMHKYGSGVSTQANYFYGDIFCSSSDATRTPRADVFAESLYELAYRIRSMKDENGDPLGYTADTIILPANKPAIELVAKQVCASFGAPGVATNDVNIHYGNWNVIVLPTWISNDNTVLIMSSEANKHLSGNMFFNRVPLTVTDWVDHHTGNYIWNGRCRFGIGFGSYKHIIMATDSATAVTNAAQL